MDYGDKLFWLSVVIQRKYAQICAEFDLTPLAGHADLRNQERAAADG